MEETHPYHVRIECIVLFTVVIIFFKKTYILVVVNKSFSVVDFIFLKY